MNRATEEANATEVVEEVVAEEVVAEVAETTDSVAALAAELTAETETTEADREEMRREYPLFSVLQPMQNNGPIVGLALGSDTAEVNDMLAMKQVASLFPR